MDEMSVQEQFRVALESFVEKVKRDDKIIAAILFGSLSYDQVWEYSDIDIYLVGKDEKSDVRGYSLVENGINIHAVIYPRGRFRRLLEGARQGQFTHSSFARSTLLYSIDPTLADYYRDAMQLGAHDRETGMLQAATWMLPVLIKAEKWLYVKRDPEYSFLWLMHAIESLARIEVLGAGGIPGREVIHQALKVNPELFGALYTDLMHGPKTYGQMEQALQTVNDYLEERIPTLFKPILDYLHGEGVARSASEISEHFEKRMSGTGPVMACEWLADKGVIMKVGTPVRLTEKSLVTLDEAAYLYDGGEM
ncbi:nucleotidyltransferase domain-containing protein [Candidatus Poribacteria bacterium]|nr:nucleotidyltransferase domain-containing protein [Candidatus Poribacteria bacterium]